MPLLLPATHLHLIRPTLLLNAGLAQTLDRFGWKLFEKMLVDAVEKLCANGSTVSAVALVEELAPPAQDTTERSQVCERIAREIGWFAHTHRR